MCATLADSFRRRGDPIRAVVTGSMACGLALFCSRLTAAQAPPPDPDAKAASPAAAPADPAAAPADPAAPATTQAGQPQYLEDDQYDESLSKNRTRISRIFTARRFEGIDEAFFSDYFTKWYLARWTLKKNLAAVTAYRKDLRNQLRQSRAGVVHDRLNSLTLAYMRKLIAESYHPAVQFNAMLTIGELYAVEAQKPADLPKPLPAALPVMIAAVKDPQLSDSIKIAALIGISRHAKLGIDVAGDRTAIASALLGTPNEPGPIAAGHPWIRGQAAEVLGLFGEAGNSGVVATALAMNVGDPSLPLYARCQAAEAIGSLNYGALKGLDVARLAAPLGHLAADAFKAETEAQKKAEAEAKNEPPTQAGPQYQPGYRVPPGMQPTELTPPVPIVSRRRLKYRFQAAQVGLEGIDAQHQGVVSLEGAPPFVAEMQKSLQAMLGLIDETKTDDDGDLKQMMGKIDEEVQKLQGLLPARTG